MEDNQKNNTSVYIDKDLFNEFSLYISSDIIYVYDIVKQKNIFSNEGFNNLGYRLQEVQEMENMFLSILLHPDDLKYYSKKIFPQLAIAENDDVIEYTCRMKHKNGTYHTFQTKEKIFKRNKEGIPNQIYRYCKDISDLKDIEIKYEKEKTRFNSYIELNGIITWITNTNGEVVEDIPFFRQYTGLSYEEIKGSGWANAIHPDDVEKILKEWKNAVVNKIPYDTEYRLRGQDGIYRTFIVHGIPLFDKDNIISEWVGILVDISERKQIEEALKAELNERKDAEQAIKTAFRKVEKSKLAALNLMEDVKNEMEERIRTENALRKSEEKYRQIAENISDVVWVTDLNFKSIYISPSIEKLIGEPIEVYINRAMEEKFTPDSLFRVTSLIKEELEKEKEINVDKFRSRLIEVEHYIADGTTLWLSMNVSFVRDKEGSIVGIQGVTRNITERIKYEEALKRSEEKYRLITEKTTDVIWLMDLDGRSIFVTPSIERFTGFTVDEYLHQTIPDRFTPGSAQKGLDVFYKELILFQNNPRSIEDYIFTIELEYVCKDNTTKWGELLITPYFDYSGTLIGIHGVTRDITERKKVQEELKDSLVKLDTAQELAKIGYWNLNLSNYSLEWSKGLKQIFELPPDEATPTFDEYWSYVFPDDKKMIEAQSKIQIEQINNSEISYVYRILTQNGNVKYLHHIGMQNLNEEGKLIAIYGSVQDITERKNAEDVLKLRETQLSGAVKIAKLGPWEYDVDKNYSPLMTIFILFSKHQSKKLVVIVCHLKNMPINLFILRIFHWLL